MKNISPNDLFDKKKTIITIISCIVFLIIIGISYAIFFSRKESDIGTITTGNLAINFENGEDNLVVNGIPIYDEDINSQASYTIFSIKNTGTMQTYTDIYLQNIVMTSSVFKSDDLKWSIEEGIGLSSNDYNDNVTKIATGNFLNIDESDTSNKKILIASNIKLDSNQTKYYKVKVWLKENGRDQSEFNSQSFSVKIGVKGYAKEPKTLSYKILKGVSPKTDASFDYFNTYDCSGEWENYYCTGDITIKEEQSGLFVQKEDDTKSNYGYPTYYYRGSVTNNNVNFAEKQWKIIRINEDGSIRLLMYNSIVSNDDYYNSLDESEFYYDNTEPYTTDYIGSNMESIINDWYSNLSDKNKNLIYTGTYCNDLSDRDPMYPYDNVSPTLTCNMENMVKINEKASLMSADDYIYYGIFNDLNIIRNIDLVGDDSFTLTKSLNYIMYINQLMTNRTNVSTPYGFTSPVINLKPDVLVSEGNGSSSTPYIIQ